MIDREKNPEFVNSFLDVSPLLDHMQIQRCISDTDAVQVYLLKNTITI